MQSFFLQHLDIIEYSSVGKQLQSFGRAWRELLRNFWVRTIHKHHQISSVALPLATYLHERPGSDLQLRILASIMISRFAKLFVAVGVLLIVCEISKPSTAGD